jgi:rsbT antagonist protein RsbS
MHGERIPIIEMRGQLLVSVQRELSDVDALALQDDILARLRETSAKGVILDVTGVEIVDSYIARVFNDIGSSASSMGAQTVLVGLRPAVAMTLVEMGVELNRVFAELTLDRALERLEGRARSVFGSRETRPGASAGKPQGKPQGKPAAKKPAPSPRPRGPRSGR